MKFFMDAIYDTTLEEMDENYPRCMKCNCDAYYHTCRFYYHLVNSDDRDMFAAWCFNPDQMKKRRVKNV